MRTYGVVHDVIATSDGPRLLARFEHETTSRRIALMRKRSREYLFPVDPRARYRALNRDDRELVETLLAKRDFIKSLGPS